MTQWFLFAPYMDYVSTESQCVVTGKSKISTCGTKDERQLQFSTFWFDYYSKVQLIITDDSVSLQFPLMPKIS